MHINYSFSNNYMCAARYNDELHSPQKVYAVKLGILEQHNLSVNIYAFSVFQCSVFQCFFQCFQ